jgi:hypothetical protein
MAETFRNEAAPALPGNIFFDKEISMGDGNGGQEGGKRGNKRIMSEPKCTPSSNALKKRNVRNKGHTHDYGDKGSIEAQG